MGAAVQRLECTAAKRFRFVIGLSVNVNDLMMHSPVYLAICAAAVSSMLLFGAPELSSMVLAAALAIAVLGVPHGGLDHWTGRRLLVERFGERWWAVFFPTYLLIGIAFAAGWFAFPTITVLIFFLISAWHFGREEQQADGAVVGFSRTGRLFQHGIATAVGGLVIWVPAVARPDEMRSLLGLIIPDNNPETAFRIVAITQSMATILLPVALVSVIARLAKSPLECDRLVPLATAIVAVVMPILISFAIYFCAWHSWQGLQRLRRDESLPIGEFVRRIAPLSVAAILGVAAVGWWMQGWDAESLISGQTSASLRTLFIGLSAIAVPHLFLHECKLEVTR